MRTYDEGGGVRRRLGCFAGGVDIELRQAGSFVLVGRSARDRS